MDKVERYRKIIKEIITGHARISTITDTVQPQLIFDDEHDHYQLNFVGWQDRKRVFGPVIQLDIQNDKIWIQYNGTEESIAEKLVQMGVPNCDIVIAFHSPFKRKFTPYAVE